MVFARVHVQVESLGVQVVRRVPVHTCAYIGFRAFAGENHGKWDDTISLATVPVYKRLDIFDFLR